MRDKKTLKVLLVWSVVISWAVTMFLVYFDPLDLNYWMIIPFWAVAITFIHFKITMLMESEKDYKDDLDL
jgi:hypothetical protein